VQPSVADLILVVTVKCSSIQVENRIYELLFNETIITNTRKKTETKEKKKKKKKCLLNLVFFAYLQVIGKMIVKIDPKMDLLQMIMMLKKDESIVMALV